MCRYRYLGRRTSSILVTIIGSARVVKTLMGVKATTFHADLKRDGYYSCKGTVYAKMFYGGMVLFSGGMASPSNRVAY